MAQPALEHGTGKYREVLTFTGDPAAARRAAAILLAYVQSKRPPAGLQILVAVSLDAIQGADAEALVAEGRDAQVRLASSIKLLIQIAAENPDQLTFGLRLTKFVIGLTDLKIVEELRAVRHLQDRENFGYRDGVPAVRDPPTSKSAGSFTWLLYQWCKQDIQRFPTDEAARAAARDAHTTAMRRVPALLRRSVAFESFAETGLAFLATAEHPLAFIAALQVFESETDALRRGIALSADRRGLFVVPSSASALGISVTPDLPPLPGWVLDFYREKDYWEYEVAPSTYRLMRELFFANARNLRESDKLREDLKMLTKGLVKLVLGHRIQTGSLNYQYLERLFGPKVVTPPTARIAPRPASIANASIADLGEEIEDTDRDSPLVNSQLDKLYGVAMKAADEAQLINDEAGEYITITI
jgi:hypothetical protein